MQYRRSVTWESFPQNIEVMFDAVEYFVKECGVFTKPLSDREQENMRIAEVLVKQIWDQFDVDKNGVLDKDEARVFIKQVMADQGKKYSEN